MAKLRLDIVTPERELYSEEVDFVSVPGTLGTLGILPHHAPLITDLTEGELRVQRGEEEEFFAIHGGFMQVLPDRVIVLADVAERADEIDVARAEEARERAQELLATGPPEPAQRAVIEGALRRSYVRLRVARRRRRVVPQPPEQADEG